MSKKLVSALVILALVIAAGVTYWLNPDFLKGDALGKKGAVEKVINKVIKKQLPVKNQYKMKNAPKKEKNAEIPASEIPTI